MKVLSVCGDPGGCRAVLPVLQHFPKDWSLRCFVYRQGLSIFKEIDLELIPISNEMGVGDFEVMLRDESPDICVLGTSVNGIDHEKQVILAARRLGITTLSILDFWSNYAARFSTDDALSKLDALPDNIAVMDKVAAAEMERAGFPMDRIHITGQPAFDRIALFKPPAALKEQVRRHFGLAAGAQLALFASQPLRDLSKLSGTSWGFDEMKVLELLVPIINDLELDLWIRPHPREDLAKFAPFLGQCPTAFCSADFGVLEAASACDLVIGMNSVFLLEACVLGTRVISLQPGLSKDDPLPLKRLGVGATCYEQSEVAETVRMAIDKGSEMKNSLPDFGGGTKQVICLISRLASA